MSDTNNSTKALILHTFNDTSIYQRATDGYLDATAMCQANGKLFADYRRLQSTEDFLYDLSSDMGIPISEIIKELRGFRIGQQGTWVHPLMAVNLAQWCSTKFAIFISKLFYAWVNTVDQPVGVEAGLKATDCAILHAKLAEYRITVAKHEATIAQHQVSIAEHQEALASLMRKISYTVQIIKAYYAKLDRPKYAPRKPRKYIES